MSLNACLPSWRLVDIAAAMFWESWSLQREQANSIYKALKRDVIDAERKTETLLDAVVEAANPRVISAYDGRLEAVEHQRLLVLEKQRDFDTSRQCFEELFEHSIRLLSSFCQPWRTGRFQKQ